MALLNTISGYQPLLALTDSPVDPTGPPDDRSGTSYVATGELLLATEVALATGRPLLLRGAPGSGKSSWASYVARNLGWRYHESVVTANTELSDFYYRFDAVRRLQDAQRGKSGGDLEPFRYLTPGPLWLGFNWSDALDLLKRQQRSVAILPHGKLNQNRDAERAVVLIDELDKADSSLPNGLL
ncbi:MAG: AAA family ATPase, partial [Planctomycetota bacterium]|nr:AAA family ATPase [Planctomycetota bacterium]